MGEGKTKQRSRRRRRGRPGWPAYLVSGLIALPALYLMAALVGSLVPVNSGWTEPDDGIVIYLAGNGIHSDIVVPARAQGLDWNTIVPGSDAPAADPNASWVAFGSGEEQVYLETATWWDIRPKTIWAALTGGRRVMHVEWVSNPARYADRVIRLRPEEYQRLWAAIASDLQRDPSGKARPVDHSGYGCCDAFYWAGGRFSALSTCNSWTADKLRIAGVKTSVWPPFVQGLLWRYREPVRARSG